MKTNFCNRFISFLNNATMDDNLWERRMTRVLQANGSREKSEVFRSRNVHVFGFRWHVVAAVFEKVPLEKKNTLVREPPRLF